MEDPTSRHSRSGEGADIDIHLIMRLLTASDDLEVLAGQAETGEVSAAEVARAAREARAAVLSAVTAWYGGPAQMVKFANALLQAARET
jgi:DNA helicase IV